MAVQRCDDSGENEFNIVAEGHVIIYSSKVFEESEKISFCMFCSPVEPSSLRGAIKNGNRFTSCGHVLVTEAFAEMC